MVLVRSTHNVNGTFMNGDGFHIIEFRLEKSVRAFILWNETLQCKTSDNNDDDDIQNYDFGAPAIKIATGEIKRWQNGQQMIAIHFFNCN